MNFLFEPEVGEPRIVAGVKRRLRTDSNCARKKGASALYLLSLYWHVFDHRLADELLNLIASMDCGKDENAWTFVSLSLAIKARRDRLRGMIFENVVARIKARAFAPARLDLNMVRIIENNLSGAKKIGSRISQIGWLEMLCGELIFVIELTPNKAVASQLESRLLEATSELREVASNPGRKQDQEKFGHPENGL